MNDEIEYFKEQRGLELTQAANEVICEPKSVRPEPFAVVIAGYPNVQSDEECLPEALRFEIREAGMQASSKEPEFLWIDLRSPDCSQGWTTPEALRRQAVDAKIPTAEINRQVKGYAGAAGNRKTENNCWDFGSQPWDVDAASQGVPNLDKPAGETRIVAGIAALMSVLAVIAGGAAWFGVANERKEPFPAPGVYRAFIKWREKAEKWRKEARINRAFLLSLISFPRGRLRSSTGKPCNHARSK
jgi:hypothetical protein